MNRAEKLEFLEEKWIQILKEENLWWEHDGDMTRPHALLTSGLHSGGFANVKKVIHDKNLRIELAANLISLMSRTAGLGPDWQDKPPPPAIFGPATSATLLAREMAGMLGCGWGYAEKDPENPERMNLRGYEVSRNDKGIWVIEDVITTGTTVVRTIKSILSYGGSVENYILCTLNRSGYERVTRSREMILALINRKWLVFTQEECSLCRAGSQAIRPKNPPENWAKLTS